MKILSGFICSLLAVSALAGTADNKESKNVLVSCTTNSLTLLSTSFDYVAEGHFRHNSGKQDAMHYDVEGDRRIPLNVSWPNYPCGAWFLRLGADYDRYDFDTENQTNVPNTLQSLTAVIALEYVVNDEAAIMLETRPGVYFEHDINAGTFDAVTSLTFAFPPFGGDKFYVVVGVAGAALWSPNVIPAVGVIWHIDDKWDLQGVLPEPRLIYKANDTLQFFAGGEIQGGGYKTDNRQIPNAKLSGGVVTYTDVRANAGVTWKCKPLTVELELGASLQREFDYNRADSRYRVGPAPYAELSFEADF